MITQQDLDTINEWYWGERLEPQLESSEFCSLCQGDGYTRNYEDVCYTCKMCDGTGLIENE